MCVGMATKKSMTPSKTTGLLVKVDVNVHAHAHVHVHARVHVHVHVHVQADKGIPHVARKQGGAVVSGSLSCHSLCWRNWPGRLRGTLN